MYHRSREGAIEYCSIYLRTPNLSEGTIIDFLCLNSVQSCVKIIPTSFVLDIFVPAAGAGLNCFPGHPGSNHLNLGIIKV